MSADLGIDAPSKAGLGVFTRGHVEARVVDQYGDERVIHRVKGSRLSVKRHGNTPAHALNRAAAVLIGMRIRELRLERSLSMAQLCKRAGLASATPKQRMYEIEMGTRKEGVRIGTLFAIAIALEVPVSDLLPDSDLVARAAGVELQTGEALGVAP